MHRKRERIKQSLKLKISQNCSVQEIRETAFAHSSSKENNTNYWLDRTGLMKNMRS
jgi:hypothetical protein